MIKKSLYSNIVLHFKKWSRKSYAVFASLGMVVSIGQLATKAVQWIADVTGQIRLDADIVVRILNNQDFENVGVYNSVDSLACVVVNNDDLNSIINNRF